MARDRTDDAIVNALADCRAAVQLFGLEAHRSPAARSAMVLCPWHNERTPSCHLSIVGGELLAHCPACQNGGDVFTLAAAVFGLHPVRDFREVKVRLAGLVGVSVEPGAPLSPRPRPPLPPPRPYPPTGDVGQLWKSASPIGDDPAAVKWCKSRELDPFAIEDRHLARVLRVDVELPGWASYERRPWTVTGHRVIVPVFDAAGVQRSVRAIRIEGEGDLPKRLPPAGFRASGLVLADDLGQLVLRGEGREGWPSPLRVVVVEGEPDFMTWAARVSGDDAPAVFGELAGAWTEEHAARIPDGAIVFLRTHRDDAGDRYAEHIAATLGTRCNILEMDPAGRAERRRTRPQREAERGAEARRAVEVCP